MSGFILRRLGAALLVVWGVLSLSFIFLQMAPGDPSSMYTRPGTDQKTVEHIRQQMGLDLPVWQQYLVWSREFCTGNFGTSFMQQRPVSEIFAEAIPNTLRLTVVVFVLQLVIGILLGVLTAIKRDSSLDFILSSVLLFLYSMPGFWLGLMAIMVFSLTLGWLPSSQMQSLVIPDGTLPILWDRIRHLILPASVLAAPLAAHVARFVRASLIEVLAQNYIRTARAYGISRWKILFKYALKNALLPLTALFGVYLPFLLAGAVITEYVFAWPGFGMVTVNAIFAHDFPVILASNFVAAIAVVAGNLISDLLSRAVDPRIRLEPGS